MKLESVIGKIICNFKWFIKLHFSTTPKPQINPISNLNDSFKIELWKERSDGIRNGLERGIGKFVVSIFASFLTRCVSPHFNKITRDPRILQALSAPPWASSVRLTLLIIILIQRILSIWWWLQRLYLQLVILSRLLPNTYYWIWFL